MKRKLLLLCILLCMMINSCANTGDSGETTTEDGSTVETTTDWGIEVGPFIYACRTLEEYEAYLKEHNPGEYFISYEQLAPLFGEFVRFEAFGNDIKKGYFYDFNSQKNTKYNTVDIRLVVTSEADYNIKRPGKRIEEYDILENDVLGKAFYVYGQDLEEVNWKYSISYYDEELELIRSYELSVIFPHPEDFEETEGEFVSMLRDPEKAPETLRMFADAIGLPPMNQPEEDTDYS